MYSYIYDIFTAQKKYERQLLKIEGMLTDLGIAGKSYKLNVLKNLEDIIDEILSNDIKNIIVVGNDQSISKVASLVVGKDIALGLIPFGEPNLLAEVMGIKSASQACQIISARKIVKLDMGRINGQCFLLAVESSDRNIIFDFKDYNINPLVNNKAVGIYNINIDARDFKSNPKDGIMEAVFVPEQRGWLKKIISKGKHEKEQVISVFPFKKLTIQHKKKPIAISIDRQKVLKTPLEVEVLPKKLKMIVGKERIFE
jgi:diacylglycerol kinase family enzyme